MKKLFTFFAAALFTITAGAANGDVTDDGWVMVEDFEGYPMGATLNVYPIKYDARGTADVAKDPTDDGGQSAHFKATDWNNIIEVPVTLPTGKVLSNYSEISFDLYINEGSSTNRYIFIYANDQTIIAQEGDDYPSQGNTGQWLSKSFDLPGGLAAVNTFNLRIGMSVAAGEEYYIDNIRLKESSEPVEPGTTQNGQIVDGLLMVEDFEALQSVGMFNYLDYPEEGTASIVGNPTVPGNKAASFIGGDFNTVLELDVTLPEKKVLSDYSDVVFDLYVKGRDVEKDDYLYKKMLVWADKFVIHQDEGENNYPKTADPDIWTKKTYPIPMEGNNIENAFKLRIGILADDADYLIDNVRLKPATATGITDVQAGAETVVVVDGGVMINAGAKAAYAVYDISGRAVSQGVADGSKTVTLQRGVYVVRVNGKAVKVLVR